VVTLAGIGENLNNGPMDNAVNVFSSNVVTGVQVSTVVNVTAPAGVGWYQNVSSPVTVTGNSPATATLTVTGYSIAPATFGFTLGSSGNITVSPGANTGNTATIAVTSTGGFTGQVILTCTVTTALTNPVDMPTCSISAPVNLLNGSSGASTMLTVNTTAPTSATNATPAKTLFPRGGAVALGLLVILVIPARRRRWITMLGLLAAIFFTAGLGCGGNSGPASPPGAGGTTAGAYIVTIFATDGATGRLNTNATVYVSVI